MRWRTPWSSFESDPPPKREFATGAPHTIITAKIKLDDDGNELVTYVVRLDDASLEAVRQLVRDEIRRAADQPAVTTDKSNLSQP